MVHHEYSFICQTGHLYQGFSLFSSRYFSIHIGYMYPEYRHTRVVTYIFWRGKVKYDLLPAGATFAVPRGGAAVPL